MKNSKKNIEKPLQFEGENIDNSYSSSQKIDSSNIDAVDIAGLMNTNITYKDLTIPIDTIISRVESKAFEIPLFQRNYVWTQKQLIGLIVSLLKDIPIPKLYLYSESEEEAKKGRYTVIDGQQRLISVYFFVKGIFPSSKNKRVSYDFVKISDILNRHKYAQNEEIKKKCENELKEFGLKFTEFKYEDKYSKDTTNQKKKTLSYDNFTSEQELIFKNKSLDFCFISIKNENQNSNFNSKFVYTDIFRLLNSAGEPLSNQEIRNGVYYNCSLYKEVNKFDKESSVWKEIVKSDKERYKNVAFLLRVLALNHYLEIKIDKVKEYILKNPEYFEIEQEKTDENSSKIDVSFLKESKYMLLDKFTTYSSLIDTYSNEFYYKESVKDEINSVTNFVNGIKNIPNNNNKINYLNLEAFFVASSKLGKLKTAHFEIDYEILNSDLGSRRGTSSKDEIFRRILIAMNTILERDEKGV